MLRKNPLFNLIRDRRFWMGPAPWVCLLFILVNLWVERHYAQWTRIRRANLAATEEWKEATPEVKDHTKLARMFGRPKDFPITFDESTGEAMDAWWKFIPDARQTHLILHTGMSQNFSINDYQSGQITIPEYLDRSLRGKGCRAFGISAPNLCNEEWMLQILAATSNKQTTPEIFIFGACFDKFRNMDLRPNLANYLKQNASIKQRWIETLEKFAPLYPKASAKMLATVKPHSHAIASSNSEKKDAENFESRLRENLGSVSPLILARHEINGVIKFGLFNFRNRIFGIKNTSKRPMIPERYEINREFLSLAVDLLKSSGVKVFIYIVPLNPQADNPYIPEEYQAFKSWLKQVCVEKNVLYANFENIIPQEHWGLLQGEPDFKHFKAQGHELTARAIEMELFPSNEKRF